MVMVAVAVAVDVWFGLTSKFSRMGASELYAGVTPFAISNGRINKIVTRIQRLANLFLCSGGCIFSIVGVIGCTSVGKHNWSLISLSSPPKSIDVFKELCQVL
jgi:hypothetical protein